MLTSVWLICIMTPPPPRGGRGWGVVRAEFDPGSKNAIPAALRRQMTTTRGGGRAKFDPRYRNVTPIALQRQMTINSQLVKSGQLTQ